MIQTLVLTAALLLTLVVNAARSVTACYLYNVRFYGRSDSVLLFRSRLFNVYSPEEED